MPPGHEPIRSDVRRGPPQPGVLDRILGIVVTTEDPARDPAQRLAVLFDDLVAAGADDWHTPADALATAGVTGDDASTRHEPGNGNGADHDR